MTFEQKEACVHLLMIIVCFLFSCADICRYGEGTASTGDESDPRADQFTATRTEKSSPSTPTDSPTVKIIDIITWSPLAETAFGFNVRSETSLR